jgi:general secretion pathway protein L
LLWRDGQFSGEPTNWRGGEVEFLLLPERCVFRELELPARAGDFLEGVVRAQIDRITPWRASEAAFGWSAPRALEGQKISVTIAAAKRGPIAELAEAAARAGADAVSVSTTPTDGRAPIEILGRRLGASLRLGRWRFALLVALFSAIAAAAVAAVAQATLGANLSAEAETLTANLAQRRNALLRLEHAGEDPAAQALSARKRSWPSAMVVLEAMSRALPDEAYLTEMRLEGDKVEIAGVAADAAALIPAMEKSPHFAQATFTAPTTRSSEDKGEVFRIEARVAARLTVAP